MWYALNNTCKNFLFCSLVHWFVLKFHKRTDMISSWVENFTFITKNFHKIKSNQTFYTQNISSTFLPVRKKKSLDSVETWLLLIIVGLQSWLDFYWHKQIIQMLLHHLTRLLVCIIYISIICFYYIPELLWVDFPINPKISILSQTILSEILPYSLFIYWTHYHSCFTPSLFWIYMSHTAVTPLQQSKHNRHWLVGSSPTSGNIFNKSFFIHVLHPCCSLNIILSFWNYIGTEVTNCFLSVHSNLTFYKNKGDPLR